MALKNEFYAVLIDLKAYKQELKEAKIGKTRIEDEIEGFEDDIKNAETEIQRLIKEFTEAGQETPTW